ncbi:imidazole glycerol phosphate synthase subunit HisH [Bacillus sp. NPDC077411]|uniref:imidazole glycerol phosphate synthase subunit HisH n=1 Tax=Bacillus sp. NPDC077411 TaxID=3363947 RepID=UPI0037C8EE1E
MIAIVDYGMGNIRSVEQALRHIGAAYIVTDEAEEIVNSNGIILPGVGAFPRAMRSLEEKGLVSVLQKVAYAGKPLLGICLGMQLLFEESEEIERTKGLGLLPGRVRKLNVPYKIPHMGWNQLQKKTEHPLWNEIEEEPFVYYVHSYYVQCPIEVVVGGSEYGVFVPGLVARENVFGAQFHPEKSGGIGIQILRNFKEVIEG